MTAPGCYRVGRCTERNEENACVLVQKALWEEPELDSVAPVEGVAPDEEPLPVRAVGTGERLCEAGRLALAGQEPQADPVVGQHGQPAVLGVPDLPLDRDGAAFVAELPGGSLCREDLRVQRAASDRDVEQPREPPARRPRRTTAAACPWFGPKRTASP